MWLKKAEGFDEARTKTIYSHSTGQDLIKSPYTVMPRRIWDLKSNCVIEYRMLEAEVHSHFTSHTSMAHPTISDTHAAFWAVTHSWTNNMKPVMTSINQYQWPVPCPEGVDLEHNLRQELLGFGGNYVWLDVLCLHQKSDPVANIPSDGNISLHMLQQNEWKIDVPTIGNIYRAAERLVRYFNSVGKPFNVHGWDDNRHWLR